MGTGSKRSASVPPADLPGVEVDAALAPLTTLGVGGRARFLARPRSLAELRDALTWARNRSLQVFVLGQGSNVVFSDAGFDGLVLQIELRGIAWHHSGARMRVSAGAGESWDDLVALAVARQCSGIECLSGIPGRVGAAPIQNIGAYGQELAERLTLVEALDARTLEEVRLDRAACGFGYRSSIFKTRAVAPRLIVLRIELELEPSGRPEIRYAELGRRLAGRAVPPALADVREAVLSLRRSKSMLLDPTDPLSRSAGSFFVNPILDERQRLSAEASGRRTRALAPDQALPTFPRADGRVKVPAAWLIEHAGYPKGFRRGAVGLSERHALAIVNYGGASAAEVVDLARAIRDGVQRSFGVTLAPEPALIGLTID